MFPPSPRRTLIKPRNTVDKTNQPPHSPKGDFIVSHHPTYPSLFLATGGSGHAYKFFPVIGDKVVDALEGKLDPELRELWQWPEAMDEDNFEGTEDGSRSGSKRLLLMEELAKSKKERRVGVL